MTNNEIKSRNSKRRSRRNSDADVFDIPVEIKRSEPTKDSPYALRGYLLALMAASLWAMGGLLAKWLFTQPGPATSHWLFAPLGITISPQVLAADRSLVAFMILVPALLIFRRDSFKVKATELPLLGAFGIFGLAMVHLTYFKTISLTNASTAILLEYLAPILVFIFAVLFQGQQRSWKLPIGLALALLGCSFVVGAFSPGGIIISPQGLMWGLGSAVAFAVYSLLGEQIASRFSPYKGLVWGLGFAATFWIVILGPKAVFAPLGDLSTLLALVAMAVVATIIPFAMFLKALSIITPAHAITTSMIEPFVITLGEMILFGSLLKPTQVIGGACVIAAIVTIQSAGRKKKVAFPPMD